MNQDRMGYWQCGLSRATALVLVATSAFAAATYTFRGGGGANSTVPVPVGGVAGQCGAVVPVTVVQSTSSWATSAGYLGAEWNGAQFDWTQNSNIWSDDPHTHEYQKDGGGAASNRTLRAESILTHDFMGNCARYKDTSPTWWWIATVTIDQDEPRVEAWNGTTEEWEDQGDWTHTFSPYPGYSALAAMRYQGNSNASSSNPGPTAQSQRGHFMGAFQLPVGGSDGASFRVVFPFDVFAAGDVDNAIVTAWKDRAHVRIHTSVSSESVSAGGWSWWF